MLTIRLLTPIEASLDERPVALGGTKQRAVLAMLALRANRPVPVDRLIEGLWGDDPPATAPKILQGYVSQLRKALPGAIVTRGHGYELRIEPGAVDVDRFTELVERAAGADLTNGEARAALELWRGAPLNDVSGEPFAAAEIRRLEELWLAANELAVEADLAAGEHVRLVPELAALVVEHPLRERLHGHRMLALYRAGRQADALEAFHDARRALGELGLEPGAELRRLQEAILRHDPSLDLPVAVRAEVRAAAERRVGQSAERAAARREDLRAGEAALADDVVHLQAARESMPAAATAPPAGVICPFKGLTPFDADDAPYYFGRERLVAELIARMVGARLVAVIGPSGSGKSSALRAGLLPALAAATLPGSDRWERVLLRPGGHPEAALRRALAKHPGENRLVLAVDQFEETFTACRDDAERTRFLDALTRLATHGDRRATVVLALRADFYGSCAAHPALARLVAAEQVLVAPSQPDELRRAIEAPARRAGLEVERALVERLLADLEGEPGALPLLSTALLELWRERDGNRLTLAAYERSGGVRAAVARLADAAYDRLPPQQRPVARRLLLGLAGDDDRGVRVRRRVALDELQASDGSAVRAVLDRLAEARLITVDADGAEVAHEALLTEWPRLRHWLEEDAEGRRLHHHLAGAARDWAERGQDPGDLYRGARLASALDWSASHADDPSPLERRFLAASHERSDADAVRARRANRRLMALLAGAGLLLVVAIVAGIVALEQRGAADRTAIVAQAERLGASALLDKRLDRSLLLARAASDLADSTETRGNLLAALLRSPAALRVVPGTGDRVQDVAVSPDGRTLALADNRGVVLFADAASGQPLGRFQAGEVASMVRYAPDGRSLLVAAVDPASPDGIALVVDTATIRLRSVLRGVGEGPVVGLAWSPDGRRAAAVSADPAGSSGHVRVWEVARGDVRGHGGIVAGGPPAAGVDFTRDGRRLVVGSHESVRILDVATLETVVRRPVPENWLQKLSPDGRTLVVGHMDGTLDFVDMESGRIRRASGRHETAVQVFAFSRDGRRLISGADDARVIVWDVRSADQREVWEGHAGRVLGAAVGPDGRTAYTASLDSTVIAWDIAGDRRLGRPFRLGSGAQDLASGLVSPDGGVLAAAPDERSMALFDTATLQERDRVAVPRGVRVRFPAFSSDGRLLGVSGERDGRGYVGIFETATGRAVGSIPQGDWANTPGIGRRLIVTGSSNGVQIWDRHTLRPIGSAVGVSAEGMGDVAISPDDRFVAIALLDGTIDIRAARTMRRVTLLVGGGRDFGWARFSRDGRLLVGGDAGGTARVWSTRDWRLVTRPLAAQAGVLLTASVAPGGRLLATSNTDGTVALWDLQRGKQLGAPLPGVPNRAVAASFTPDGRYLFASYATGVAYRWDMRVDSWRRKACAVAGRGLTRGEWEQLGPTRPFTPVCE